MSDERRERRIAIIGSGFSGLCLGIQLKRAGIDSFTIYEKADRLGGTWRDNTYPGAACDVPSFAYCFSFEQKTDWTRKWSSQAEIQQYMEHCARKYDVERHIRFGVEIAGARFDEATATWQLQTAAGESIEADVLVCAVGQLNRPYVPPLPGLEDFRGVRFHSARWNHAVDLTGKRIAVVGNAASAIQFIPQIAPQAERLTIFQRTANWMIPRGDRAYTEREKRLFTRFPFLARLYRWWIWLQFEMRFPAFLGNPRMARAVREMAEKHVRETVRDPSLHAALIPDYPIGGKRLLITDDYYQTLNRENVRLVTSGIDHIGADEVVACDGSRHPADVLILATGFESTKFLAPMRIEGRGGRSLAVDWAEGARAYRGITVAGYPNLFLMYGPNTNLGHNSIIFMIECQTSYIVGAIRTLVESDLAWLDVREQRMEAYDQRIQGELARTVWAATPRSWYKTEAGRITNNWSGSTVRYWWTTRRFDRDAYRAAPRGAAALVAAVRADAPASARSTEAA